VLSFISHLSSPYCFQYCSVFPFLDLSFVCCSHLQNYEKFPSYYAHFQIIASAHQYSASFTIRCVRIHNNICISFETSRRTIKEQGQLGLVQRYGQGPDFISRTISKPNTPNLLPISPMPETSRRFPISYKYWFAEPSSGEVSSFSKYESVERVFFQYCALFELRINITSYSILIFLSSSRRLLERNSI